jgi:hypothetical protein
MDPRRGCFMPDVVQVLCQRVRGRLHFATASIRRCCAAVSVSYLAVAPRVDRRRPMQQPQHPTAIPGREAPRFSPVSDAQQLILRRTRFLRVLAAANWRGSAKRSFRAGHCSVPVHPASIRRVDTLAGNQCRI